MRISHHHLILGACAISIVSLLVAIVSISFAMKEPRESASSVLQIEDTIQAPEPGPLSADNPASKLFHTSEKLSTMGGLVQSISRTEITVGSESAPQTVRIDSSTKIYQRGAEKSSEKYDAEFAEFSALLRQAAGATEVFVAPDRFETTPLSYSDISKGDLVLIRTVGEGELTAIAIYRLPPVQ